MKALVVIVHWRTPQLVVQCLRALAPEIDGETTVVVTDNKSGDDSVEVISRAIDENGWHWCQLRPLPRNGGFAYGNNRALERMKDECGTMKSGTQDSSIVVDPSSFEYVYLLNPDTIVFPGVLRELTSFMDIHPACGIAGSRAENRDGTVRKSAFRFHSIAGEFERQAELGFASKLLKNSAVGLPIPTEPARVDWVSGCGMMIRRDVFERVGLLDETYFMYYEETDFCLRANRAGFECWYVPASRLIHLVGQASGVTGAERGAKRRPAYWFESRWRYFEKNHSWLYAVLANIAWIAAYTICVAKRFVLRKPNPDPPRLWRDFVAYNFCPAKRRASLPASRGADIINRADGSAGASPSTADKQESQALSDPTGRIILGTKNQNPRELSFFQLVREDLRTHENDIFSQGFWALFQHRFGNWRMGLPKLIRPPFTILYRMMHKWVQWTCGISLSYTVKVGRRVRIWHFGGMVLGAKEIGNDVHIRQNTTMGVARRGDSVLKKPVFEDRVDVGAGAVIAGDIRIGHDSVIGANAVVLKDVPPYSVVVGIPGKVIKTLAPAEEESDARDVATPMPRIGENEVAKAEVA